MKNIMLGIKEKSVFRSFFRNIKEINKIPSLYSFNSKLIFSKPRFCFGNTLFVTCWTTHRINIFCHNNTKKQPLNILLFSKILSNSIAPRSNSASQVTSDGFNKDYQETSSEVSQIPNGTSDNPDIKLNKLKILPNDSKW